MDHLEFYRRRLRPAGVVDWERWRSDTELRLATQKPIRLIEPLAAEDIFRLLLGTPEPSYQEVITGAFISDYLLSAGVRLSSLTGTAPFETHLIFADGQGPFDVALRCDLDAVATGEGDTRSYAHVCGHATNMAALLTLAPLFRMLSSERIALIFQPAEEGPGRVEDGYVEPNSYGGGQYLRRKGIYRQVRALVSCHLDAKLKPNEVRITPGIATAAAYRFSYCAEGYPCHAALPENGSNPIDGVRTFLSNLDQLRQELGTLPVGEYGLITATQIRTSANDLNTLPRTASVSGIVRVLGAVALAKIRRHIPDLRATATDTDDRSQIAVSTSLELEAPPVLNDPQLARCASTVARQNGFSVNSAPARFRDETAWAGRFDEPWVENAARWPAGCEKILHFFVSPGSKSGGLHTSDFMPDAEAVQREAVVIEGIVRALIT